MTSALPVPVHPSPLFAPSPSPSLAAKFSVSPSGGRAFVRVSAMATASATMAVSGLAGSSLAGKKLAMPAKSVSVRAPSRVGAVTAKYGEGSVYFDLGDINNTTGNWDLYGNDDPARYNPFQSKFFETFAGGFTKRGLLLKFLVLGGATTIGYLGSTSSPDLLAIKRGPQSTPIVGPRERK